MAKEAFAATGHVIGLTVEQRQREIDALPLVEWKGRWLRTIRCTGERGRGPHPVNVPESLLWALIDFSVFRCQYHA